MGGKSEKKGTPTSTLKCVAEKPWENSGTCSVEHSLFTFCMNIKKPCLNI